MVTRTTDRIRVSEDHLSRAVSIIEQACRDAGLDVELEVADYVDSEIAGDERTLLIARIITTVDIDRVLDAYPIVGRELNSAGLLYPTVPLSFVLEPQW